MKSTLTLHAVRPTPPHPPRQSFPEAFRDFDPTQAEMHPEIHGTLRTLAITLLLVLAVFSLILLLAEVAL